MGNITFSLLGHFFIFGYIWGQIGIDYHKFIHKLCKHAKNGIHKCQGRFDVHEVGRGGGKDQLLVILNKVKLTVGIFCSVIDNTYLAISQLSDSNKVDIGIIRG